MLKQFKSITTQKLNHFSFSNQLNNSYFQQKLKDNLPIITNIFSEIYAPHPQALAVFEQMIDTIYNAYHNRSKTLLEKDSKKLQSNQNWFLSNQLVGMSLYIDRFANNLSDLENKIPYLQELGINLIHIMPIMQSPLNENDGGYAVSDFTTIDPRFGNIEGLKNVVSNLNNQSMNLMMDIVLNHTSNQHSWALEALQGNQVYQDYYYFFNDRQLPNLYDQYMPEIFPESAPGNFTYLPPLNKHVMTVFHQFQWDLNYSNPTVFLEMLKNIFYYANLGIDILRIDAPAFIWKELGTTCQNLPTAHSLLKLIKLCVEIATPGTALLAEAIVAPKNIMEYFGKNEFKGRECDLAYNATLMALQWDALATGDTRIMLYSQKELQQKPIQTSWITYTRCHDDIGLGYDDQYIQQAGFNPYSHRQFIKDYYIGKIDGSMANGLLFAFNEKTQDARLSGSLASLCGLEKALLQQNQFEVNKSIQKILLMQAMSLFVGGIPMLFYGDELGYCNDYSFLQDEKKSYDNRWTHRPQIDWLKNDLRKLPTSIEHKIFTQTKKLISIRKQLTCVTDLNNILWIHAHNIHVAGFLRQDESQSVYFIFNFSQNQSFLTWHAFKEQGLTPKLFLEHSTQKTYTIGLDNEYVVLDPYQFLVLEVIG